jgi:hypothetical protein
MNKYSFFKKKKWEYLISFFPKTAIKSRPIIAIWGTGAINDMIYNSAFKIKRY